MVLIRGNAGAGIGQGLSEANRGFLLGGELGLRKRALQDQEQEILHRAQIQDAELRREEAQRQAGSAMVGDLAQLSPDEMEPNTRTPEGMPAEGPPTPGTQAIQDADQAAMSRVHDIAQRMAAAGDLKGALAFVDLAHAKHTQAKDHRERDNLVKEAQMFLEGADTYSTAPDGSRVEDPALAQAVTEVTQDLADKSIPTAVLRQKLTALKQAQIQARARQGHRQSMIESYMQRSADALAASDPKAPGRSEQTRMLETLRNEYEINHDRYYNDPKWQAEFDKRFSDAEKGVVEIPNDKGEAIKVPISSAPEFQRVFAEKRAADAQNLQLKNKLLEAQADAARQNSLAKMVTANKYQSRVNLDKNAPKPPTFKEAFDIVSKKYENSPDAKPSQDDMIREARELVRKSVEPEKPAEKPEVNTQIRPDQRESFAKMWGRDVFESAKELDDWLTQGILPKKMR